MYTSIYLGPKDNLYFDRCEDASSNEIFQDETIDTTMFYIQFGTAQVPILLSLSLSFDFVHDFIYVAVYLSLIRKGKMWSKCQLLFC